MADIINNIVNIFRGNAESNYITEVTVTSHPTLSRPIVDTFISRTTNEIDYYHQHSLGRIYKAILQMKLMGTRRKFLVNSWIGSDFDRGLYKFYDAIYSIEDSKIKATEIFLTELKERGIDFDVYRNVAALLNKLQDRSAILKFIVNEFVSDKITSELFFQKVQDIYLNESSKNITTELIQLLSDDSLKRIPNIRIFISFISEHGLSLSNCMHFRLDGAQLLKDSTVDHNILKIIDIICKNKETNVAIIIANCTTIDQLKNLEAHYKKINGQSSTMPRIIPLIEGADSVDYFINNYDSFCPYLGEDCPEVMLAGSDMTKCEGFFGAQNALYNFISRVKAKNANIKIFLGSGTTIFRTGGQLQISRLRHKVMNVFAEYKLNSYNQTLQGGGVSFEGFPDRSVVDLLRNYSKIRAISNDKLNFNSKNLATIATIAHKNREEFWKKYESDFNSIISGEKELTTFGIGLMNDFGGSRDVYKSAFTNFVKNSRAIQFYTCFLNFGISPIILEIPHDPEEYAGFKKIITNSIKKMDISTHYLLTVAAIQTSYASSGYLNAMDINETTPMFIEIKKKAKNLEDLLDETGYNMQNKSILNIIAEEWRIDNFSKLKDIQKLQEINQRKETILTLLHLRTQVSKRCDKLGAVDTIKYINFAINDVKINGMNKQIGYLIEHVEKQLHQLEPNFESKFVPYSFYGLNKIVPYKN